MESLQVTVNHSSLEQLDPIPNGYGMPMSPQLVGQLGSGTGAAVATSNIKMMGSTNCRTILPENMFVSCENN